MDFGLVSLLSDPFCGSFYLVNILLYHWNNKNMPVEKSAGAIIFRREIRKEGSWARNKEGKYLYLLLHYPSSGKAKKQYWDLPKGHIEKGEKEIETVKREVGEETGISKISFIKGFREPIKYFFRFNGETVFKTVVFLLAETNEEDIKISEEHLGFAWMPYESALKRLTFKNAKDILSKANEYISRKGL